MGFSARRLLTLALVLAPSVAYAQAPTAAPVAPPAAGAPAGAAPAAGAPAGAAPAPNPAGPGAAGEAPPEKKAPAAGYAYTDKPARRASHGVRRTSGPVATLPGFEQLSDGGSRLFVQLSKEVPVEERHAQGVLTYIFKGAHVHVWNNTNALVTVHFNTPVWRARLVQHGNELHFVIDLRAVAAPTSRMVPAKDGTASFVVDFAKGDFTNTEVPAAAAAPEKPRPRALGRRGPRGRVVPPPPNAGPKP